MSSESDSSTPSAQQMPAASEVTRREYRPPRLRSLGRMATVTGTGASKRGKPHG